MKHKGFYLFDQSFQVFCVHGGIPSPDSECGSIEAINQIPSPLCDPEVESPLAWELLWSDPLRSGVEFHYYELNLVTMLC